eukprot:gene8590-1536_t
MVHLALVFPSSAYSSLLVPPSVGDLGLTYNKEGGVELAPFDTWMRGDAFPTPIGWTLEVPVEGSAPPPSARYGHSALDWEVRMLVFGGRDASGQCDDERPLVEHVAGPDAHVVGAESATIPPATQVYAFNLQNEARIWAVVQTDPQERPPGRFAHAAYIDPLEQDTWKYDMNVQDWVQVPPGRSDPGPLWGFSSVNIADTLWIHGGCDTLDANKTALNNIWVFGLDSGWFQMQVYPYCCRDLCMPGQQPGAVCRFSLALDVFGEWNLCPKPSPRPFLRCGISHELLSTPYGPFT